MYNDNDSYDGDGDDDDGDCGVLGIPTAEFTQADLAANCIVYVHTSQEELYMDKFTFSVSDGTNEVSIHFCPSLLQP